MVLGRGLQCSGDVGYMIYGGGTEVWREVAARGCTFTCKLVCGDTFAPYGD